jgi:DNA-binding CsgD family transcriptional regulator
MNRQFVHLKPSFTYSEEIAKLTNCLAKAFELDLLNFSRFFSNRTSLGLYSHPQVIKSLLQSNSTPLMLSQNGVLLAQGGYFFSEIIDFVSLTLTDEALTRYKNTVMNLGYQFKRGYVIILKSGVYSDVFFFSNTRLNPIEEKYYISQIRSELLQFCYFYLDQISKIISKIQPDHEVPFSSENQRIPDYLQISRGKKDQFKFLIRPKRYSFQLEGRSVSLSKREFQTLVLFIQGFTYKAIGDLLGLSKRTVETYGLNIKNKIGNDNRQKLYHLLANSIYSDEILNFSERIK